MARQPGLERIINFSDGVVAIAATLLILPLVDTATIAGTPDVSELMSDNRNRIFGFVLSFVVIGRFWLAHQALFLRIEGYTSTLVWANYLWLVSIVFLPFPTELISSSGPADSTAATVYLGTLLLTTIAAQLQVWILVRSPQLQAEAGRGTLSLVPATMSTVVMALILLIAVAVPSVGLWALLLLVPMGMQPRFTRLRERIAGHRRHS